MTLYEIVALAAGQPDGPVRSGSAVVGRVQHHGSKTEFRDAQDRLLGVMDRSGSVPVLRDPQGRTLARFGQ